MQINQKDGIKYTQAWRTGHKARMSHYIVTCTHLSVSRTL